MAQVVVMASPISSFDPFDPAIFDDPVPSYHWLLEEAPLYWCERGFWVLSRFDDVWQAALDFETYYDQDYTLSKLSTSEYIRDPRFKAQMCGIKVGNGKTRIIPAAKIRTELGKINWATHSLLCHNTQFDGFILSHHYGIHPAYLYDSLSMARGLHSNDIGAGLDEVSVFYGGCGKVEGALKKTNCGLNWYKTLFAETAN